MNKMILAVLASATLTAAGAAIGADKAYVTDGSGNPVMIGSGCVVAAGSGTAYDQCGSGGGDKMDKMAKQEPAPAPEPKVITKVIVDCSKCK